MAALDLNHGPNLYADLPNPDFQDSSINPDVLTEIGDSGKNTEINLGDGAIQKQLDGEAPWTEQRIALAKAESANNEVLANPDSTIKEKNNAERAVNAAKHALKNTQLENSVAMLSPEEQAQLKVILDTDQNARDLFQEVSQTGRAYKQAVKNGDPNAEQLGVERDVLKEKWSAAKERVQDPFGVIAVAEEIRKGKLTQIDADWQTKKSKHHPKSPKHQNLIDALERERVLVEEEYAKAIAAPVVSENVQDILDRFDLDKKEGAQTALAVIDEAKKSTPDTVMQSMRESKGLRGVLGVVAGAIGVKAMAGSSVQLEGAKQVYTADNFVKGVDFFFGGSVASASELPDTLEQSMLVLPSNNCTYTMILEQFQRRYNNQGITLEQIGRLDDDGGLFLAKDLQASNIKPQKNEKFIFVSEELKKELTPPEIEQTELVVPIENCTYDMLLDQFKGQYGDKITLAQVARCDADGGVSVAQDLINLNVKIRKGDRFILLNEQLKNQLKAKPVKVAPSPQPSQDPDAGEAKVAQENSNQVQEYEADLAKVKTEISQGLKVVRSYSISKNNGVLKKNDVANLGAKATKEVLENLGYGKMVEAALTGANSELEIMLSTSSVSSSWKRLKNSKERTGVYGDKMRLMVYLFQFENPKAGKADGAFGKNSLAALEGRLIGDLAKAQQQQQQEKQQLAKNKNVPPQHVASQDLLSQNQSGNEASAKKKYTEYKDTYTNVEQGEHVETVDVSALLKPIKRKIAQLKVRIHYEASSERWDTDLIERWKQEIRRLEMEAEQIIANGKKNATPSNSLTDSHISDSHDDPKPPKKRVRLARVFGKIGRGISGLFQ